MADTTAQKKKEALLQQYPSLRQVISWVDDFLVRAHPTFFGPEAIHPVLPLKPFKVVHDNLWGTNRFSWQELTLIDSPILQRLRRIHQVGLAYHVYPSARHTRFEHCLGVVTIASRVFEALLIHQRATINNILKNVRPGSDQRDSSEGIARLRQELRLAALLHDSGHSICSHTSELVYQNLDLLKAASRELTTIVAKEKGAGEVISFALALSDSVAGLLARSSNRVQDDQSSDRDPEIDMVNVALLIVGRGPHPLLQFLGDIISSGFDADKLDYLMRDASAAGLPLRYDLERYLYSVRLEPGILADGEGELGRLYAVSATIRPERRSPSVQTSYPHFDTYRVRLPGKAMSAIEQIIICKLMLFGYIYHHPKVRAAEGLMVRVLRRMVAQWREEGEEDGKIFQRFLDMTDYSVESDLPSQAKSTIAQGDIYRIKSRLLPREVYRFGGMAASSSERAQVSDFLASLQDKGQRDARIAELEQAIGEEILKIRPGLASTPEDALGVTGVWFDVPKPPKFEDVDELVIGGEENGSGVDLVKVFPIDQWTQAYVAYRYYVRVFAFSEYVNEVAQASQRAMTRVIGVEGEDFYKRIRRNRS